MWIQSTGEILVELVEQGGVVVSLSISSLADSEVPVVSSSVSRPNAAG